MYADIDGDGRTDVCQRLPGGVACRRSALPGGWAAEPWQPESTAFSDYRDWDKPARYKVIALGDLDGDGKADLCGRAADGLNCARSAGTSFGSTSLWSESFSDSNGWGGGPQFYETIQLVDVNGDGRADACGRGESSVFCVLSNGVLFEPAVYWTNAFGDSQAGQAPSVYRTLDIVDVDGDGDRDVCGRRAAGIACSRWNGEGFSPSTSWSAELDDASGWDQGTALYGSIRFADVTGDGRADVCAVRDGALRCAVSLGTAFGPLTSWSEGFADASADPEHLVLVDLNDDGKADACVPTATGLRCGLSNGSSLAAPTIWSPSFATVGGACAWGLPSAAASIGFGRGIASDECH